jgi:hypothetical protein
MTIPGSHATYPTVIITSPSDAIGHDLASSHAWSDLDAWYADGGDPNLVTVYGSRIDDIIAENICFHVMHLLNFAQEEDATDEVLFDYHTMHHGRAIQAYRSWIRHGGNPFTHPDWRDPMLNDIPRPWHRAFIDMIEEGSACLPAERVCADGYLVITKGADAFWDMSLWGRDTLKDAKARAIAMSVASTLASRDPLCMAMWMQRMDPGIPE